MIDEADPSYVISSSRTPIPATGEQISITTIAGIIVLLSLCFVGIVIYKKET
jgi:LPXTG-motif cell wall-anchored protein